ncbi:MAG: hypothetical protein NT074_07270 [Methanomicrobiales archaeon]|nr:hypothetical protein [Methanomicrobiales archaeon]
MTKTAADLLHPGRKLRNRSGTGLLLGGEKIAKKKKRCLSLEVKNNVKWTTYACVIPSYHSCPDPSGCQARRDYTEPDQGQVVPNGE